LLEDLTLRLLGLDGILPYLLVLLVLLACGLGLPVPEDITLIAGGLAAYYGHADVWRMIGVSFLGVLMGDSIVFLLGRKYGLSITRLWPFSRLFSHTRIEYVRGRFQESGNRILFLARFMPGLRAPIYFTAGTVGVKFRTLILYDGLAALLSVPAIVYASYAFGDQIDRVLGITRNVSHGILFAVALLVTIGVVKWWRRRRQAELMAAAGKPEKKELP
jgi:membrane protein DedA with SNARE-associated domain